MEKATAIKSERIQDVQISHEPVVKTGDSIVDKWFSREGGIVVGSAIYVSGTSGAGKTTKMVNLMKRLNNHVSSMYLREMESRHVKYQTSNIQFDHNNAYVCDASQCPTFEDYMKELESLKPKFVFVDSLQVIALEDYALKGIMTEESACYHIIKTLREWCSKNSATLFLIGHNTKDGNFAGRNTIIQMMDAHIEMVHDKKTNSRTMSWGQKNRKGPMGTLYYIFGEAGMEFFTEEMWNLRVQPVNFQENFITFVKNYIEKLNPQNETHAKLLEEYKKEAKFIKKLDDTSVCIAAFELLMKLSAKYGM